MTKADFYVDGGNSVPVYSGTMYADGNPTSRAKYVWKPLLMASSAARAKASLEDILMELIDDGVDIEIGKYPHVWGALVTDYVYVWRKGTVLVHGVDDNGGWVDVKTNRVVPYKPKFKN